jgi:glyoxylase-like metal-dependent hydrolase (beta-lactamase superfamily II)
VVNEVLSRSVGPDIMLGQIPENEALDAIQHGRMLMAQTAARASPPRYSSTKTGSTRSYLSRVITGNQRHFSHWLVPFSLHLAIKECHERKIRHPVTVAGRRTAFAAPLQLDVYNPQEKGIFPVSSTLVSGPKEAVLFDAQFSVKDGEELVKLIKARGKTLKEIVITSGDPDFYFGLEPLVKAFPQAKVVASKAVVDHIKATKEAKLAFWGPQMKDGAPTTLIVPQATTATRFTVDGETLELKHAGDYAAYVWIPANKAILGGTGIASGIHVWTADTADPGHSPGMDERITRNAGTETPTGYSGSLPG